MIIALLKTSNDFLRLTLPISPDNLQSRLKNKGIEQPPEQIRFTDCERDAVRTKLLASDEMWNGFRKMCGETNTLSQINAAANKLENVREDIQDELHKNITGGQYKSLSELIQGIDHLEQCNINLYCPLTLKVEDEYSCELYETDNGLLDNHHIKLKQAVALANSRDPNNMAKYYQGEKLQSAMWDTALRGGSAYGCIHVKLSEPMTGEEMTDLKDWIKGQNSDGWGESFEQHPIQTEDGNLYVSFWHAGDDCFLYDDQEADQYIPDWPELSEPQL